MKSRQFLKFLFLILFSTAITLGLSRFRSLTMLEEQTYDARQIAFAPETKVDDSIAMIWLDKMTMGKLPYRSPVPRDFLASLLNKIGEASPKLIALDIFFEDPSFEQADLSLIGALQNKKSPIFAVVPKRPKNLCEMELPKSAQGCVAQPLDVFKEGLSGTGLSDLPYNPSDSTVRAARLSFETDLGNTPTFAELLFQNTTGKTANGEITKRAGFGPFYFTPADDDGQFFIRFAGPPSKFGSKENVFPVFSAFLVEKGIVPARLLENKIILIGADFSDMQDAFLTPYFASTYNFARMNGVEVHANILSQLLSNQFYYMPSPAISWMIVVLLICLAIILTNKLSTIKASAIVALIIGAYWIGCAVCFKAYAALLPLVLPTAGTLTSYATGVAWRALVEGRQKRWIKGVFSRYVPPAVVEQMTAHPDLLKLGGEQKYITSLFSDIASFTSISERLDPPTLVKFLNEYLSLMNDIIFKFGGAIDKYEGDAIIAFFNAPLGVEKHEEKAVLAALHMQDASKKIGETWKEACEREIVTRIGINTGPAVVGNMGSEGRFDYTAIGDTINLASRLEGTNKFYDTRLMISESTAKGLSSSIILRPVDKVRVKGKKEAVLLYEPFGTSVSEERKSFLDRYMKAWELFYNGRFDEASAKIKELKKDHMDDGPLASLEKRCIKASSEQSWDLITDLMSK